IRANSWYRLNGVTPGTPVNPLTSIIAALAGGVAEAGGWKNTSAYLQSSGILDPAVTDLLNSQTGASGKPKAYLNWLLLDEQYRYAGGGYEQVGDNEEFKTHIKTGLTVNKNGYLYIYVSNETPNVDVFFDNVQVSHVRGPLMEETHYYPFGLTMAGISSKAAGKLENRYKFNGNKLENKEFSDGSGLEMYDFNARTYDQQIGRFMQVDPELEDGQESWTPYHFGFNNPPLLNDPDGKNPIWGAYRAIGILAKIVEWSTNQSTVAPVTMTPTFLRDGTSVVKTIMDLKTFQEVKSVNAQAENKEETARGSNNQKTRESAKTGQEAHRQEQAKLKQEGAEPEVTMQLKDGTVVRKDAVRPDGTSVIIKPDTKTGRASADKRAELMEKNGHKTEKILYDSKDPKYQPGSPSYIGPKKTS
ncbi:MAG: RHS repeat-associated core domain-containing protein, partial [Sediminibacterium sp.]